MRYRVKRQEMPNSGSLALNVDRDERERRNRRANEREKERKREGGGRERRRKKVGIMRFPLFSVDKSGGETMREWRKRKESEEKRTTVGKKKKYNAHCGDKRHRRRILSIDSFGLLLTGIHALTRHPSLIG